MGANGALLFPEYPMGCEEDGVVKHRFCILLVDGECPQQKASHNQQVSSKRIKRWLGVLEGPQKAAEPTVGSAVHTGGGFN